MCGFLVLTLWEGMVGWLCVWVLSLDIRRIGRVVCVWDFSLDIWEALVGYVGLLVLTL